MRCRRAAARPVRAAGWAGRRLMQGCLINGGKPGASQCQLPSSAVPRRVVASSPGATTVHAAGGAVGPVNTGRASSRASAASNSRRTSSNGQSSKRMRWRGRICARSQRSAAKSSGVYGWRRARWISSGSNPAGERGQAEREQQCHASPPRPNSACSAWSSGWSSQPVALAIPLACRRACNALRASAKRCR